MNRRHFLAGAVSATATLLAGCQPKDTPATSLIGFWQSDAGTHPTLLHIGRKGDNYRVTQTVWRKLFGVGYKSRSANAQLDDDGTTLVVAGRLRIAYDKGTDMITAGKHKARRITETEYNLALGRGQ